MIEITRSIRFDEADAEARRVDELTALRKQDTALIRQLVEALAVATTPLAKDRQEVLAAITAARARLEWLGKLDQHLEGLASTHTQ